MLNAWGFLAVFFAAVALRQAELKLIEAAPDQPQRLHTGEHDDRAVGEKAATVSEGSLVFQEHLERLPELVLALLVGGSLFVDSWSWRAVSLALFLFLVARPLSAMLGLMASRNS